MGTPRRHPESLTYHVMFRGNNRMTIFYDDADRRRLLRCLKHAAQGRGWTWFAYCLMDNHVHCVVRTQELDLGDGFRDAISGYARIFNKRYGRSGHVFSERFRAVGVEDDAQLLTTIRYVALNPVRAGLVEDPFDWSWSSYAALLSGTTAVDCGPDVSTLELFHPLPGRALQQLHQFVVAESDRQRPSVHTLFQLLGSSDAVLAAATVGWTQGEIAEALGIGRPAVSKRIRRLTRREPETPGV